MSRGAIGVFDSGLGGLTAVKHLIDLLPEEDIVFFGDTARVPYGSRTKETLARYSAQDIAFLLQNNVKMVIAACGTVSSTIPESLVRRIPVPFVTVIRPTAEAAVAATKNRRIGIIGTSATVASGAFQNSIKAIDPAVETFSQACPLFVPLVENGYFAADCEVARLVAKDYLAPLKAAKVDTLILGCTHYPILRDVIQSVMGPDVTLIDSGRETARYAVKLLRENDLLGGGSGQHTFYTSDNADGFSHLAELFLGHPLTGAVHAVSVDSLDDGTTPLL